MKVQLKNRMYIDNDLRKAIRIPKDDKVIQSEPVNCLCDIPITHLAYHSKRYGKFAIGFHRQAVIKHGFNPVLYTLHDSELSEVFFDGISGLQGVNLERPQSKLGLINDLAEQIVGDSQLSTIAELSMEGGTLIGEALHKLGYCTSKLQKLLAFTKTFSSKEFYSIYCEREWRSLKEFKFRYEDVAMILLPKKTGRRRYYQQFLNEYAANDLIPREVPIISWEDLIEH